MSCSNLLGLLLACSSVSCLAQNTLSSSVVPEASANHLPAEVTHLPGQDSQPRPQAAHSIALSLIVTDSSGAPISGLKSEDFVLLDNQHPQTITAFQALDGGAAGSSVHVILVLDGINNPGWAFNRQAKEMERFVSQGRGPFPYPVTLAIASSLGVLQTSTSRDGDALLAEFAQLTRTVHSTDCSSIDPDASGQTAQAPMITTLNGDSLDKMEEGAFAAGPGNCQGQHFAQSIAALGRLVEDQEETPGRVLLVWVGPGWPLLPLPARAQRSYFKHLVSLTASLRDAQVTLDLVSPADLEHAKESRGADWNGVYNGTDAAEHVTAASIALRVLAHQSGGRVFSKSKDAAGDISACLADAGSYYSLSFEEVPAAPSSYHSVDVKVNRPGITVRTVTSYYTAP